jgi:hypothetical protein
VSFYDPARRRVGVLPMDATDFVARLLGSLEEIFPVVFEGRRRDELRDLDGVLAFDPAQLEDLPPGTPTLTAPISRTPQRGSSLVEFAETASIRRPLRGRRLVEDAARFGPDQAFDCTTSVLATANGRPAWWNSGDSARPAQVSTFPLADLSEGEALRDQLRAGRFMGLVPLLHFLWDVCGELNWGAEPLQASFVIDDPNLHWTTYGHLRYPDLIRHACAHGYHVGLATVPLDGWLINRRAASLVRHNGNVLSLLVHGNDHTARELGGLSTDREAQLALGQALTRVAAFERRSGVPVKRVMAPPHGACSEAALRAMFTLGFDAACMSRPYPWRARGAPQSPLVGWHPAEMVVGGFPVVPRYPLSSPREDLVFRALLRQPLILYGHHGDLEQGLDVLAQAADYIDGLGDVKWGPLDWIATGNHFTRQEGRVLHVQVHSRQTRVKVPAGVSTLRVHITEARAHPGTRRVIYNAREAAITRQRSEWTSELLDVDPGSELTVALPPDHVLKADTFPHAAPRPWPVMRRGLVEARDRARPLVRGVLDHAVSSP